MIVAPTECASRPRATPLASSTSLIKDGRRSGGIQADLPCDEPISSMQEAVRMIRGIGMRCSGLGLAWGDYGPESRALRLRTA